MNEDSRHEINKLKAQLEGHSKFLSRLHFIYMCNNYCGSFDNFCKEIDKKIEEANVSS